MENRYDKYKDSGIEWIGEIPEHWNLKRIKNICDNLDYLRDPISAEHRSRNNPIYDYYGASGVIDKIDYYNVDDKVLLIGEDGANLVMRNLPLVYKAKGKFWVNNHAHILKPKNNNYNFCAYAFEAADYSLFITGSAQPKLSQENLGRIKIVIPPLPEQQTIATYLDQKCGEIDELITLQEEMITKLQRYKQSVITEAVTKGLDKNVPLKDSGIEWIGEIPEHWEVKRLKYFGNNYNGLTYSPNDICNSQEGTIVLRSSNIKDNKLCFDDNVYVNKEIPTKLFVNKGDILICSRNGSASLIGKAALIETDIKATFGAFMMIFKGNNIHHKYLYYIVTSCISQYKWLFTTATINQLTSSMLGEIFAPSICDRLEQQTIADYLDKKCSEIDELISIKQQKIEKLKDYKKSLIFECVTGKRKVS